MSEQISWQDFKQAVSRLCEEGKYQELLDYFKVNKADFQGQIAADSYVLRYLLKAVRKSGHSRHIFTFMDSFGIVISDKTNKYLLNEYGWGLLDNLRSSGHYPDDSDFGEEFFDHAAPVDHVGAPEQPKSLLNERIMEFLKTVTGLKDSFFDKLVSALFSSVLKTEKKKPAPNWRFVSEFCDLFDPGRLSTECQTIQTPHMKKKTTELASDQETWYAAKVKSLYILGEYRLCLELAEKALDAVPKYHYSNDAWFARWIALSLSGMGDARGAITRLEEILKRKHDWFIQKELAELHHKSGNTSEALKLALEAVNSFGELKFKVDLMNLLASILKGKGQNELAFRHLSLGKMVRRDEGWGIPGVLLNELDAYGLPEIPWSEFDNLKKTLKTWWREQAGPSPVHRRPKPAAGKDHGPETKSSGVIKKILHDNERGKFGFVRFDGDNEASFNIPRDFSIHPQLREGIEIEFALEQMPDGKYRARNLRLKS